MGRKWGWVSRLFFVIVITTRSSITGVGINRLISLLCRSISQQEDTVSFIEHENKVKENLGKTHNHRSSLTSTVICRMQDFHLVRFIYLIYKLNMHSCIIEENVILFLLSIHSIRNLHHHQLHHLRSCGRNNAQDHLLR